MKTKNWIYFLPNKLQRRNTSQVLVQASSNIVKTEQQNFNHIISAASYKPWKMRGKNWVKNILDLKHYLQLCVSRVGVIAYFWVWRILFWCIEMNWGSDPVRVCPSSLFFGWVTFFGWVDLFGWFVSFIFLQNHSAANQL